MDDYVTVGELIDRLKDLPLGMRVVTRGFDESCYDDVGDIKVISLKLSVRERGHCGAHDESDTGTPCLFIDF